jgi:DNA-binding LacI/PurR family transcriptional regulator
MPTIKDVARASGVSTATVSYVLNGTRTLPKETQERVRRAVREMNYHPSAVAQGLNHKRLNTLGLLFGVVESPGLVADPYASGILQGVLAAASQAGYNVTFITEPWRNAEISASRFLDGRTDGVLVVAPDIDSDIVPGLAAREMPMVSISFDGTRFGVPSVDVDNAQGARLALSHLLALGHRRIAHLSGPSKLYSSIVRRETYCSMMQEAGIEISDEFLVASDYSAIDAYFQAKRLLAGPKPPTAIFAANDALALAVMHAAHDLVVSVPEQLSVVGFDDISAGTVVRPALTTVHQPLAAVGEAATCLLVRRMSSELVPAETTLLEPSLIVRATTAPPLSFTKRLVQKGLLL